jgi:hypothetical protein
MGPEDAVVDLQREVSEARERLEDLSALMVVANNLDQSAEAIPMDDVADSINA